MDIDLGSIDHLSQVISQVVAPSFLLGAVASFISMLFDRMSSVAERIRTLRALPDDRSEQGDRQTDIVHLRKRVRVMHRSILLAIGSGITTTLLIIMAFATALLRLQHMWGSAALFMIALTFFCASLVLLAIDVAVSVSEYDRY